jgi:hypothetical protein
MMILFALTPATSSKKAPQNDAPAMAAPMN